MTDPKLEWDPSIAALIAEAIEAFNVCELWLANCQPTCDLPNPKPLPVLREARAKLESAASALTSHVWDRNAPTVPYVSQMLQQDIDVARTFNESSDPRAMLAFIKLLAVGRAQPPSGDSSALRGVRVTKSDDQDSTRVDGFPEGAHGDLPRRLDGDE